MLIYGINAVLEALRSGRVREVRVSERAGGRAAEVVAAAQREGVKDVVLCGGVAANKSLRAKARTACDAAGLTLHVPPMASCTDNAAMIAYAGALALERGVRHDLEMSVNPSLRVGT